MKHVEDGQTIKTSDAVRDTVNEDGAVLLDIKQGLCFSMNPLGARIWSMLKNKCPLDQIASAIEEEFQVPRAQVEADISEFLNSLKMRNLIQVGREQNTPQKSWLARLLS